MRINEKTVCNIGFIIIIILTVLYFFSNHFRHILYLIKNFPAN